MLAAQVPDDLARTLQGKEMPDFLGKKKVLGKLNQVLKKKDLEEFNQVLRGGAEELENSDAQGTVCAQKYLIRKFAAS